MARDVILARRAAFIAAALAATASACSESNPQPCLSVGGSPATDSSTGGSAGADAALDAPSTGGSAGNDSDGSAP